MVPSRRLLVVGLDGASDRTLAPRIRSGEMPVLRGLIEAGTRATLMSVVPPVTAPAWATIASGANPGRHRVFSFFRPPDGTAAPPRMTNSLDMALPWFWEHLARAGVRSGVVNVPQTFPPRPFDGFMLCAHRSGAGFALSSHPEPLADEVARGAAVCPTRWAGIGMAPTRGYLQHLIACLGQKEAIDLHLMRTQAWDCFFTVTGITDAFQHLFWKHFDPAHRLHSEESRAFDGLVRAYHQRLDRYLGAIVREAGPETSIVLVSDHGFGPLEKVIHVNAWLEQEGFLHHVSTLGRRLRALAAREGFTPRRLLDLASRLDVLHLRERIGPRFKAAVAVGASEDACRRVDWRRSQAVLRYAIEAGIYLAPGAHDAAERIREGLSRLRDPQTGQPVFERVYHRSELYEGNEVALAPDLLLQPREGYACSSETCSGRVVDWQGEQQVSGFHRMEGVFIASGPGFRPHQDGLVLRLCDVAPTVLAFFGLPTPAGMDGHAVREVLRESSQRSLEAESATVPTSALLPDEDEGIRDQLSSLGYL